MVNIYAVPVSAGDFDAFYSRAMPVLSVKIREKIETFLKKDDSMRSLAGEMLIRNLIHEKFGINGENIRIDADDRGKPFWKNGRNFHFNISHAGRWVVCAIGDKALGVDVEEILPIDLGIEDAFFSKEERDFLFSRGAGETLSCFYEIWTLKESLLKATGKGLSVPLNSFTIKIGGNEVEPIEFFGRKYYLKRYKIEENYPVAVCALENNFPDSLVKKELCDLIF